MTVLPFRGYSQLSVISSARFAPSLHFGLLLAADVDQEVLWLAGLGLVVLPELELLGLPELAQFVLVALLGFGVSLSEANNALAMSFDLDIFARTVLFQLGDLLLERVDLVEAFLDLLSRSENLVFELVSCFVNITHKFLEDQPGAMVVVVIVEVVLQVFEELDVGGELEDNRFGSVRNFVFEVGAVQGFEH